jgi:hypothetical protein
MLRPDEQAAWDAYVAEMEGKGLDVDLSPLIDALLALDDTASGQVLAETLGVSAVPVTDLAKRLTLQTRTIVETGRVPTE